MISLIDVSKPPGVFKFIMTKLAFSFSALSIVFLIYSEVIGWIGAWIVIFKIDAKLVKGRRKMRRMRRNLFFISASL